MIQAHLTVNAALFLTRQTPKGGFAGYACGLKIGYGAVLLANGEILRTAPLTCLSCLALVRKLGLEVDSL